ncbi:MAG TPA: NADH-quinone oxidoreductase subunit L, partial [Turneriella sp.]|nr:NADH-quinone oxidoreductase subunit L [Turneriella sp.]
VMMGVVLFVSLTVLIFSVGYLADRKKDYARFYAWVCFFMFSMLLLATAANLMVFFIGWELVGVSSYKLISFYMDREDAQRAGIKAFILNRIGDAAFLVAMFAIFRVTGTADFRELAFAFSKGSIATANANFIGLMIFIAVAAKSAQIPLYTWLPDAMTGPTPVSALIHAATMVTAGIFLMLRLESIFVVAPEASNIVAWTGGITALLAAFVAVAQTDIKKVLAFSTVSQLGLMVLAVGTGSYVAAFFHLFTHAFFKAMLFLGAGAVIVYRHHEQNIRRMGGIVKAHPFLAILFWLALIALAGLPGLSGFFSKDHIMAAAFSSQKGGLLLGTIAVAASLLTAFYSFRLGILVFHGKDRLNAAHDNHHGDLPSVSFYLPLVLLVVPTVLAGYIGVPAFFTGYEPVFFEKLTINLPASTMEFFKVARVALDHHAELLVVAASIAVAIVGALAAIVYYGILRKVPVAEGAYHRTLSRLSLKKLYIDEIYHALFVNPYKKLGDKIAAWDFNVLPKISDGIGLLTQSVCTLVARLQSGELAHYAAYMVAGVALLLFIAMGTLA